MTTKLHHRRPKQWLNIVAETGAEKKKDTGRCLLSCPEQDLNLHVRENTTP